MSLSSGRTLMSSGPAAGPATALRSPSSSSNDQDDPFAPPPEGAPDRPWQPRTPPHGSGGDQEGRGGAGGSGGQGEPGSSGSGGQDPSGDRGDGDRGGDGGASGPDGGSGQGPGSPWSSRQPGRHASGFGGSGPGAGPGQGPKFDINDPVQRRARYALLAGMWAFFFSLFNVPQLALLLGALALYWGISSLRAKPRGADSRGEGGPGARPDTAVGTGQPGASGIKPQRVAALSGIAAGGIALAMVLGLFITQMVYRDYFDCVSDALTSKARASCSPMMPDWLRTWTGSGN